MVFRSNISSSSVRFNCFTKIREDFLNLPIICDLQVMVGPTRSFVVGFQTFVAVCRNFFETGCLFPHLRTRFWFLDSVLDNVPLAISHCFPAKLETSGPKEEDCPLFKLVEIKHTDLVVAAAGSPSIFLSCILFDMVVAFSIERTWLRENMERFMMLTKRRRLHHSSRETAFSQQISELAFGSHV